MAKRALVSSARKKVGDDPWLEGGLSWRGDIRLPCILDELMVLFVLPDRTCGLDWVRIPPKPLLPFMDGVVRSAVTTIDFGRGLATGSLGVPLGVEDRLWTRDLRLLDRGVMFGLRTVLMGVASLSVKLFRIVCFGVG